MTAIAEITGSAPIFTEGSPVSFAATTMEYDIANHGPQGAYYAEFSAFSADGMGAARLITTNDGATQGRTLSVEVTRTRSQYNPATLNNTIGYISGTTVEVGRPYEVATNEVGVNLDGVLIEATDYVGDNIGPTLEVLINESSPVLIRDIRRYDLPYDEAKAKIDELMGVQQMTVTQYGSEFGDKTSDTLAVIQTPDANTISAFITTAAGRMNLMVSAQDTLNPTVTIVGFPGGDLVLAMVWQAGSMSYRTTNMPGLRGDIDAQLGSTFTITIDWI